MTITATIIEDLLRKESTQVSKRTFAAALVAAFALLFGAGCSKANAPETPKGTQPQSAAASPASSGTTGAGMKMQLKIDPPEPNPGKPAKFNVTLTDGEGKPVTGADVNVSLVMKTMDMGKNEFKLADKGNGDYQGEGKFGMSGDWNVVVTAKQGSQQAQQKFPAKSVMAKP